MWKFPGKGSNPHQSSNQGCCSDNAGSWTLCATSELPNIYFMILCLLFYYAFKMHVRNTFQLKLVCWWEKAPSPGRIPKLSGNLMRMDVGLDSWIKGTLKNQCAQDWVGWALASRCVFVFVSPACPPLQEPCLSSEIPGCQKIPSTGKVLGKSGRNRPFLIVTSYGGCTLPQAPHSYHLLPLRHVTTRGDNPLFTVIILILQKTGSKPKHKLLGYSHRQDETSGELGTSGSTGLE